MGNIRGRILGLVFGLLGPIYNTMPQITVVKYLFYGRTILCRTRPSEAEKQV